MAYLGLISAFYELSDIHMDLNMAHAGAAVHPSQWASGGYEEIDEPRRPVMYQIDPAQHLCYFEVESVSRSLGWPILP